MSKFREFGCILPTDIKTALKHSLIAEKIGFDHIWLSDHVISLKSDAEFPDAWVILPVIGMETKRIKLGSGVSDSFRRHPVGLAHKLATLDKLTNGRATLGIGAGEAMNLVPFGMEMESPVTRLKEAIIVIKTLLSSNKENPGNFKGKIFNLQDGYLQIHSVQKPHPPIYVGALGIKTRRITGELGDGWFPWIETPQTYKQHLKDLGYGVKKAGRKLDEIDRVAAFYSAISEDSEEAYKSVEPLAKMALVLERSVAKLCGHEIIYPEEVTIQKIIPQIQLIDMMNKAIQEIPFKLVAKITVIGTVEDCISKIEKYIKAGATSVAMFNAGPNINKTYEAYGKSIIPYFKEEYS